jgi:hypothetical protein
MKLRYVTITGADDAVNYNDLLALHKHFPFVEWAILFSQAKIGSPRYPTLEWVVGLMNFVKTSPLNLSAHLCGKWVSDILDGSYTFFDGQIDISGFKRVQLNLGIDKLRKVLRSATFFQTVGTIGKPILMGGNYAGMHPDYFCFIDNGLYPLFDSSGGNGVVTRDWPAPVEFLLCGYAGGLGPDDLHERLQGIERVVGDAEIWIDMETCVRSDNKLDLEKVRRVLEIAKAWVPEI